MQANSILEMMDSQALTAACSRQAESGTLGWRPSWAPDWRRTSWYVSLECRQRLVPHSLVPGKFHIHFPPSDEMFYETIYCFLNMYVLRTIGKNSEDTHLVMNKQWQIKFQFQHPSSSVFSHSSIWNNKHEHSSRLVHNNMSKLKVVSINKYVFPMSIFFIYCFD